MNLYEGVGEPLVKASWAYYADLRNFVYVTYKTIENSGYEKKRIINELIRYKIMGTTLGENEVVNNLSMLEDILKDDGHNDDEVKVALSRIIDILFISRKIFFGNGENKILIASMDDIIATLLVELLIRGGFSAGHVRDLDELLYIVDNARPDLILIDLSIFDFGSNKFHEMSDYNLNEIPLIAIADEGQLEMVEKEIKLRIFDYIIKPFNPLEIACRIRLDLERYSSFRDTCLRDALTNAYNRSYFIERLYQEFGQFKRNRRPFSVMFLDIDKFKDINDIYGHVVGDKVLKEFSFAVMSSLRNCDVFCRYGGDEFVILMPDTDGKSAVRAAERIRENISSLKIDCGETDIMLSFSAGVKEMDDSITSCDEIIKAADAAMYAAKQAGGNRTERVNGKRKGNIIVVDSGKGLLEILRHTFDEDKIVLISPDEVHLLENDDPAVLLINDISTKVDGKTVLNEIKNRRMDFKVIYLTEDKNVNSIQGADIIFYRPFSMTELENEIYKLSKML